MPANVRFGWLFFFFMRTESEVPEFKTGSPIQDPPSSVCAVCGTPAKTRFCSRSCRLISKLRATRSRRPLKDHVCKCGQCGKPFPVGRKRKSYRKTWSLRTRMGARGAVSPQTNVPGLVQETRLCIVPSNMPGSASRTNLCALSPDEVKAFRKFFLLLNEWNEAEDSRGH